MQTRELNICLHDIVANKANVKSIYDITVQQLKNVIKILQILRYECTIDNYSLFFDDGYKSSLNIIQSVDLGIEMDRVHFAIATENIGKSGFLKKKEVVFLAKMGCSIDSHSVSHSALAIFVNNVLQTSPNGGNYENTVRGKDKILTIQEIQYQISESGFCLASILGNYPSFFVLPYGLYNKEVVYLLANSLYSRVFTCDAAFDTGQFMSPRLIITQENIDNLGLIIKQLPNKPNLLI